MGEGNAASGNIGVKGKLILPTLAFSSFATETPGILTGLLLIDIGVTFGVPVGIMGQVRTVSSIVAVFSALLVGVLSVRYNHRSLLGVGLLSILVSGLGCAFAQSYIMMLIFYPLTGFGLSLAGPMALTLIAEYFTLEGRSRAIGWFIAGGSMSYVVGSQVISYLAGYGGWRLAFLGFVVPAILVGLLLTYFGLPGTSARHHDASNAGGFVEGYKAVLYNRSAVACLICTILRLASFQMVLLYGVSFFRQYYEISRGSATFLMTGGALSYTVGSLSTSRFVGGLGRKRLTVFTSFLAGFFTILMVVIPNFWGALVLNLVSCWFFGMANSSAQNLNLEQVPGFRSIMMALNSATGSFGAAFGSGIGGFLLLESGYVLVGQIMGLLGVIASILYMFLAVDPTAQTAS